MGVILMWLGGVLALLSLKTVPELAFFTDEERRDDAFKWASRRPAIILVVLLTVFSTIPIACETYYTVVGRPPSWFVEARQWVLGIHLPPWFVVPMIAGAGTSIGLWRRHIRRKLRLLLAGMGVPICKRCGNDIRGQSDPRCPKCGTEFDPSTLPCEEHRDRAEVDRPISVSSPPSIFEVLMDALCCIMVSDRRASTSERKRIHEIMKQAKCPWNPGLIDQSIDQFVARVKDGQYRRLLEATCENLKVVKEPDKENTLLKCLAAVAQADGKVQESERKVYERFKIALE